MSGAPRLVVVTGKGGVGKTVVSAALGRRLADGRRRVLLLEADPRENLHHLFGAPPSGGERVEVAPRLAIRNANPRAILDDVVKDRLKIGALSKRVLASPIYQHFADGAPGLKEMMLLGHAFEVTETRGKAGADVVVLDAPASGHGLSLLAAPLLVAEVIGTGPLGSMARKIADLVADPERCRIVLVTLAEEMPVQETIETAAAVAARLGRPVSEMVVNAIWPALPRGGGRGAGEDATGGGRQAGELWRPRRAHNELALARLAAAWDGPRREIPLLGADFGPALLDGVVEALA